MDTPHVHKAVSDTGSRAQSGPAKREDQVTEPTWLPITYRDFYDVPRLVVVEWRADLYLLDSPFDEALDDYADIFPVYRLPPDARGAVAEDSWAALPPLGEVVGQISVGDVRFDSTRRKAMSDELFQALGLAR